MVLATRMASGLVRPLLRGTRRFASDVPGDAPLPKKPLMGMKKKKQSKDARFVNVGLPLLLFVVGGYVGLTQFVGGKYEARDHVIKSHTTRAFDLEEEHQKMTKKLILDDFELKPVPKPSEPSK
uniref:Uncharacterized protein n=1 Tax=Globisporangium ultimum (strain ATCC 200006 / CBS 805.95 / DAOM BR144) TaxID=431595 RepID=K3XAV9_GLOUD